jgi:hypothetical protein
VLHRCGCKIAGRSIDGERHEQHRKDHGRKKDGGIGGDQESTLARVDKLFRQARDHQYGLVQAVQAVQAEAYELIRDGGDKVWVNVLAMTLPITASHCGEGLRRPLSGRQ